MTYFFFYGIFKDRGKHSHLFDGCEQLGPAEAPGFVILGHVGPAAMIPGSSHMHPDAVAKGTVCGIPDELLPELLEFLDRAESNGRSYIRVMIEVLLPYKRMEAYTYLWMEHFSHSTNDEILTSGSWC